jgi:hypothetical protein
MIALLLVPHIIVNGLCIDMLALVSMSNSHRRSIRGFALLVGLLLGVFLLVARYPGLIGVRTTSSSPSLIPVGEDKKVAKVAMVVASQKGEDTTWLQTAFLEWEKNVYITNDPTAELTVPANKGRESMVYLT